jgi:ubiquinone/menaquinone biosynthesis C-methylase UbiE
MSTDHASFVGSVPDLYDRHLGPLFMVPYATDLAARVKVGEAARVLELAAGTGILTQQLAAVLPPTVTIEATDLNDAMLSAARARVSAANVKWQTADATALPFEPATFDAAVCQFGVMFFPDKVEAARQVRRALKPGAAYWFNVWSSLADNPLARISNETVATFFDAEPPNFYQTPFGYYDRDVIVRELRAAGFTDIDIEAVDKQAVAKSAADAAIGLVQGNPVIGAIRERARATPEAVTAAVAQALAREFGDAPLRAPMRGLVVRAR